MNLVFVYGTLKSGHFNNQFLKGCEFLGEAQTFDEFWLLDGPFPMLVSAMAFSLNNRETYVDPHPVRGELYRVSEEHVHRLDQLEGHPNHFIRDTVVVFTTHDNRSYEAQAYFYNRASHDPVFVSPKNGVLEWRGGETASRIR